MCLSLLGFGLSTLGGAPRYGVFSYTLYVLAPREAPSYPLGVVFLMLDSLVIHIMCWPLVGLLVIHLVWCSLCWNL